MKRGRKPGTSKLSIFDGAIRNLANRGKTYKEITQFVGCSYSTLLRYCKSNSITVDRQVDVNVRPMPSGIKVSAAERNRKIISCYLENHTLEEVGHKFNITRERVRQILNANGIKPRSSTTIEIPSPPKRTQTFSERFWSLVDQGEENECWEFNGKRWPNGYGRFASLGKVYYAHRLAYMLTTRQSPKRWILHHCDNPSCVNPKHLYDGSPKQNVADRDARGRSAYLKDPEGWKQMMMEGRQKRLAEYGRWNTNPSKISQEIVAEIKLAASLGIRQCEISKTLNIPAGTVHGIVSDKCINWNWLPAAKNFSTSSPLLVLTSATKSA